MTRARFSLAPLGARCMHQRQPMGQPWAPVGRCDRPAALVDNQTRLCLCEVHAHAATNSIEADSRLRWLSWKKRIHFALRRRGAL